MGGHTGSGRGGGLGVRGAGGGRGSVHLGGACLAHIGSRRRGTGLSGRFDSGVRGGADVLKALALGADAVCLGRPYVWGLALAGQAGVEAVLKTILGELDLTMALCGLTRPDQLGPDCLTS